MIAQGRTRPPAQLGAVLGQVALGAFACFVSGVVRAGPPYQTDDPEPVDLHHYEINVAVQQTLTASGRSGAFPNVEVNYGGAPDVQFHVGLPLAFSDSAPGETRYGFGDIEFGVKLRVLHESDTTPMVAVYPTYVAATGSESGGLGNGRPQIFLPVWMQKSAGPWTVDMGGGYWVNHAAGARDNWFAGGLLQRKVSERLSAGVELYHRSAQTIDTPPGTGFNVGGTYDLSEHCHLLISVGEGLQNRQRTNSLSSYIGYQITD